MDVKPTQEKLNKMLSPKSYILDIGAGKKQHHAKWFRSKEHIVDTVDFFKGSTYLGNFNDIHISRQYDCVWASHCLEHQLNVNMFLKKIYSILKPNGLVAITVPPLKHQIVGGHVTLWNAGLVCYNLVLAGFDCSRASIKSYDYNVSVIAKKGSFNLPKLTYDRPDLKILNKYMPSDLDYGQYYDFNGQINEHNW